MNVGRKGATVEEGTWKASGCLGAIGVAARVVMLFFVGWHGFWLLAMRSNSCLTQNQIEASNQKVCQD
jgi:hypothetical protein